MSVLENMPWDLFSLLALCLINLFFSTRYYTKIRRHKGKLNSQKHRIHDLEDDVRALYESATTLGDKVQSLEQSSRMLQQQQEQLSLKEPNQQTYRNAIQAIHNGESVNQVADNSGLSRGEVELLTLLQNLHNNSEKKPTSSDV